MKKKKVPNKQCHQHVGGQALPSHHKIIALPNVQQWFKVEITNLFHHTKLVISHISKFIKGLESN
jgi:hypothetical protein